MKKYLLPTEYMKKRFRLGNLCLVIIALLFISPLSLAQKPIRDLRPTVILISLDGFRYDYLDKFKPPVLSKLAKEGIRAKWMIPSFPTKTFPNHYTIATGLYPEHHGIVENNIWDFGATFTLDKREEVQNSRWWLGEPIWVTVEKQGQRAAAFFFPGTEAEIAGKRPSIWKEYDGKIPNEERVDTVLGWLDLPSATRPRLITMYFSDTDSAGHGFSPDSEEVRTAVNRIDSALGRLVAGLEKRKIDKKVNLLIVSDHGMATIDQRNAVVMDDYFEQSKTERVLTTGEIWQVFPKEGELDNIMTGLSRIQHATCWRKADIPARLNYNEGKRIAPVICSAAEGWSIMSRERYESQKKGEGYLKPKGAHGYDNRYQSMMATFIAHGKAFRKSKIVEPFENVEIYNVMCKILGLKPAKNDGNLDHVRGMLK